MATYWLSFTLDADTIGSRTYSDRYNALYDAIHEIAGTDYWQETTSFIIFSANETINEITDIAKSAVSPRYDLVLIRELDSKSARIFGPIADNDIFDLMPYLKTA